MSQGMRQRGFFRPAGPASIVLLLALLLPAALLAADKKAKTPPPVLDKLSWLAGSWRLERAGRVVEEQWMAPAAGAMLGMGRTIMKGRELEHEFLQIRVGPGENLFYIAQISGGKEGTFQLTSLTDREAVFENPEQDFPRKISYTLRPDGSLLAAIEGVGPEGDVKRIEFPYQRVNN